MQSGLRVVARHTLATRVRRICLRHDYSFDGKCMSAAEPCPVLDCLFHVTVSG